MAGLPLIHLCPFGFQTSDPVVVGTEIDGGTSLAGIQDTIAIDGGGSWQWNLSGASFGGRTGDRRDQTLAWRAINAQLSGGNRAVFPFCDRLHQPVYSLIGGPSDPSAYDSPGAAATVTAVNNGQTGGLNCTSLNINIVSERALIGGERFTYVHSTWLDRCAEIATVTALDTTGTNFTVTFQPPIRGGINVGDALDFDNPRCVMRRTSAPSNALNLLAQTTQIQSFVLVEDMRDPDA